MRIAKILGAAAFVGAPAAGLSQPQEESAWAVERSDVRCTLTRRSTLDQPTMLVRTVPGSGMSELWFVSRQWARGLPGNGGGVTIRLQPSETMVSRFSILLQPPRVRETEAGQALTIFGLNRNFIDALAASQTVRIERGNSRVRIPVTSVAGAVEVLRRCETEMLVAWGIDPDALAAVRTLPRANIASVITDADYPAAALGLGLSGTTYFRLMIATDGRVEECAIVVTSGHRVLDDTTCDLMRVRLRMSPALDAEGRPIRAPIVSQVRWAGS